MSGAISAALSGSVLILLVALLRAICARRAPRRIFPALWCVCALRLLLPVRLSARFSILNLLPAQKTAQTARISDVVVPFPALASSSAAAQTASAKISPAVLLWLLGAVLLAGYFALGYFLMVRRFRAEPFAQSPLAKALLSRFARGQKPKLRLSESRRAPLSYGIVRPVVLLPSDLDRNGTTFSMVLAHELTHVSRKDALRKLLLAACLCLYWWNPLVWLMVILAGRDIELACDEAVLQKMGESAKKSYALSLLDMAERQTLGHPLFSGFAKSAAESRLRAIMRYRRAPRWAGVCVVLIFLAAGSVFATARPISSDSASDFAADTRQIEAPISPAQPTEDARPAAPQSAEQDVSAPIDADVAPAETPVYIWPLTDADAEITHGFGSSVHPLTQQTTTHYGIDIDTPSGSSVLAAADGTVTDCSYSPANGYILTLSHSGGVTTQYAHLSEFLVSVGDTVVQGQIVAESGSTGWSTGPHLHFAVMLAGEYVDPMGALSAAPDTMQNRKYDFGREQNVY